MQTLDPICEGIRAAFAAKNSARDQALARSRELIRHCSQAIRTVHRREWDEADERLTTVREAADELLLLQLADDRSDGGLGQLLDGGQLAEGQRPVLLDRDQHRHLRRRQRDPVRRELSQLAGQPEGGVAELPGELVVDHLLRHVGRLAQFS